MPGLCAGGLEGEPCAVCPEGKTWSGGECADCGATSIAWATVALLVLVGSRAAYFFVNEAVARQQVVSPQFCKVSACLSQGLCMPSEHVYFYIFVSLA